MSFSHSFCLRLQAIVFGLFLATCFQIGAAFAQPLNVGVTIAPQAWLVDQIGGDLVKTETLVPAGSDPHTYEPKPSQMVTLTETRLYLTIGLNFENAWLPRIQNTNPTMQVVSMDAGVEKIAMAAHGHGHEEHLEDHTDGRKHGEYDDHEKLQAEGRQWMDRHGTPDPHIWTDPNNMRIMAKNTFEALQQADKAHAEIYVQNYFKVRKIIEKTEMDLMKLFSAQHGAKRAFLVFHPAWGYFARAHALTQVPIEVGGKEPSPRELGAIIHKARDMGVGAIFVQPQRSRKAADMIAGELGATVIEADPLAYDWPANLRSVAGAVRDALK